MSGSSKQGGSTKPVVISSRRRKGGKALPVIVVADANTRTESGKAQPIFQVDDAYVAAHGLISGAAVPVIQQAGRGEKGGRAIPVYVVSGSFNGGGGGGGNPPVANFTADVVSGFAPLTVNFTDLSTNSPTSWLWTFGDAGTSMLQNPTHVYATPGTYTVTLTAGNAAGNDAEIKNNYITALWTPAFATTGGGVSPHTWFYTDASILYQDSAKTTPVTADGDPVGAAVNQGSDSYDVIQATSGAKPTYKTGIQNGQAVLRFDGGDLLRGAFGGGLISQPMTGFFMATLSGGVNNGISYAIVDGDDATNRGMHFFKYGIPNPDAWVMYAGNIVTGGAADNNPNIFTFLSNGASSEAWKNGVSEVSGNAGSNGLDGLTVGANRADTFFWVGDIAEILIYNANLSTADKIQVQGYLSTKYNIAVGDYST